MEVLTVNIGIQPLLDSVTDFLPSPLEVEPARASLPGEEEMISIRPEEEERFSGLVFKIIADRHVGKLAFARIYSGSLKAGSYVYNSTRGKKERVGRLVKMHANHREETDMVLAGDIVALIGLKDVQTGDTLCQEDFPVLLESIHFPNPVIQVAIEPKTQSDQDHISEALARISSEDPTFQISYDPETGSDSDCRHG